MKNLNKSLIDKHAKNLLNALGNILADEISYEQFFTENDMKKMKINDYLNELDKIDELIYVELTKKLNKKYNVK